MPHSPAEIYRAAIRFDAEVAAGEQAALRELLQEWGSAKERIRESLSALLQVRRQRERSPSNSVYGRWEEQRFEALVALIEEELSQLLGRIGDLIALQQTEAIEASLSHAQELVLMQWPDVHVQWPNQLPESSQITITASWRSLPREVFASQIGFLSDGSPLRPLLAQIAGEGGKAARQVLLDAALQGWGARKTAKKLFEATDASVGRSLLIARTETARAYREASHKAFEANEEVLAGWMWCASFDRRTCAGCLAKHGSIHPVSERLMDHPAGRCVAVPVTQESPLLEAEGVPSAETWLEGLSERDQVLILGSQEARQAWASGEVALSEFAGVRRSRRWGDSIYRRSITEIRS